VSRIVLPWTDIKSYRTEIGPTLRRPPRPTSCLDPACPSERIWYDGWRHVFSIVLADGGHAQRIDEGLPLQRAPAERVTHGGAHLLAVPDAQRTARRSESAAVVPLAAVPGVPASDRPA
jgi:hypothetical protein